MTEQNTCMMREVFKLLSAHEEVPEEVDEKYWGSLVTGAAGIYNRYPTALTASILRGVIDGLEECYKELRRLREAKEGQTEALPEKQLMMEGVGHG